MSAGEESPAPEEKQPKRPGGPVRGKPVQGFDGKWHDVFLEPVELNVSEGASPERPEPVAGLDRDRLKGVNERAIRFYEGKDKRALFGVNFELSEDDLMALDALVEKAKRVFETSTRQDQQWKHFLESYFKEKRRRVGGSAKIGIYIGEDPSATDVKTVEEGEVFTIRVPTRIKHLYVFLGKIQDLERDVKEYRANPSNRKSAVVFGETIKDLYRFVKEETETRHGE